MTVGELLDRFKYYDRSQEIRFHTMGDFDLTEILSVYENPFGTILEIDLGGPES